MAFYFIASPKGCSLKDTDLIREQPEGVGGGMADGFIKNTLLSGVCYKCHTQLSLWELV